MLGRAERQDFRNGGHWSERGCTRNVSISSATKTVCECTHLTHFGILLSTNPPKLNPQVEFSLTVIGYVGTTVSLITMTLTVFTFIILKYVSYSLFYSLYSLHYYYGNKAMVTYILVFLYLHHFPFPYTKCSLIFTSFLPPDHCITSGITSM